MKQIKKINNSELSFRLKLNYNNVFSRLMMLFGPTANIFAEVMIKAAETIWYAADNEEYTAVSEAPQAELKNIRSALEGKLRPIEKELSNSKELAPFANDILDVPDNSFVFYRHTPDGYKFLLAGWGCKLAHTALSDTGGIIKRIPKPIFQPEESDNEAREYKGFETLEEEVSTNSGEVVAPKPEVVPPPVDNPSDNKKDSHKTDNQESGSKSELSEKEDTDKPADSEATAETNQPLKPPTPPKFDPPKREQHVKIRVINQHQKPVEYEAVRIKATKDGEDVHAEGYTDENGEYDLGNLTYHSTFAVSFPGMPDIQERTFEVEPKVEHYEVFIKKYVNYSPVLFVEDQNGDAVSNYNVKVVIAGQDTTFNTGSTGMIQLPTVQEGQKFIVIDSANYANSQEYSVTNENAKVPYRFIINRVIKSKVGITVLDKNRRPIEGVEVDVNAGVAPYHQVTDKAGRAEFPSEAFTPGEVALTLNTKGQGIINTKFKYAPENSEYTVQLQYKKPGGGFNWKWLMLLPLLLLLAGGGYWLYNKYAHKYPTVKEMEKGVCLIFAQTYYKVDLNLPNVKIGGFPAVAYFAYDENKGNIEDFTYNPDSIPVSLSWGTGFLISDDGLIATNKHVAAPEAPEKVAVLLKKHFQADKNKLQLQLDNLNNKLSVLGEQAKLDANYGKVLEMVQNLQDQIRALDEILNTGNFKVEVFTETSVAFTDTRLETYEDFIACSQPLIVGDPGGVAEKDLAIIQIKKKQDIPQGAFIFKIPEEDYPDAELSDNFDITVLGYNKGPVLQHMKLQDGIKPQAQHGKITNTSEKYRIGYDAPTLGGSSGSPVVSNKGVLIAVNNSGIGGNQGFNYGIRAKYLKELFDEIRKKQNLKNN